jgi:flagellar biosynthesis protein FlhB
MAEDSDLEGTKLPSQRRPDQAWEKGQFALSKEKPTLAVCMAGGAMLCFVGASLSRYLKDSLRIGLTFENGLVFITCLIINPISSNST